MDIQCGSISVGRVLKRRRKSFVQCFESRCEPGLWRINGLSGEDEHKWTVIIAVALTMSLRRAKNRNFALASTNCGRAR